MNVVGTDNSSVDQVKVLKRPLKVSSLCKVEISPCECGQFFLGHGKISCEIPITLRLIRRLYYFLRNQSLEG